MTKDSEAFLDEVRNLQTISFQYFDPNVVLVIRLIRLLMF